MDFEILTNLSDGICLLFVSINKSNRVGCAQCFNTEQPWSINAGKLNSQSGDKKNLISWSIIVLVFVVLYIARRLTLG